MEPPDVLETDLPAQALGFRVQAYGMARHADLFTRRQLAALTVLTDLVPEARDQVIQDGGDEEYADAVATYLALGISRLADYLNSLATWNPTNQNVRNLFQRHAVPMTWDFAEANPLSGRLSVASTIDWVIGALKHVPADGPAGHVNQLDASVALPDVRAVICTDPPYYDNIGYSDLSDFFYVWLRRGLRLIHPSLFATLLTPKSEELIASPYRFSGDAGAAERHFEEGFGGAFRQLREHADADYPATVFYAYRQAEETNDDAGVASTGWETMLEGLIGAGFGVTGTWPIRTTKKARAVARDTNALASAVVLVCRLRPDEAPLATRREFVGALRSELPDALRALQQGNIAPVDLAQAAIGPGMAVFSRHAKVVEADGSAMTVRTALGLINQALDEILAEQEGDFDADTRFAVTWFEQRGMEEGPFGEADVLARAKNTSVTGLGEAGVLASRAGKVRLLSRAELPDDWDPVTDRRPTAWEAAQHLTRRLETGGEDAAAELLRRLGGDYGEQAKELAYRLYSICERKGWAQEALGYNALVVAWPEIARRVAGTPEAEAQEQLEV